MNDVFPAKVRITRAAYSALERNLKEARERATAAQSRVGDLEAMLRAVEPEPEKE